VKTSTVGKVLLAVFVTALCIGASTGQKSAKEAAKMPQKTVDSGSFGIFVNGKRIGTETFRIDQGSDGNVASSQIKVDDGSAKAEQNAEMRFGADGSLRQYSWHSTLPLKEESIIEPNNEFLVEHITFADQKKQTVPYILPLSTVILDDNFFSHREILVWRYLATGCVPQNGHLHCSPTQFGTLVPHQHLSGSVTVELMGRDKIAVRGVEKELNKVQVTADGVQWLLWVGDEGDSYRVIKMTVAANNVEIIRD
jgi:hypothetical protein